MFNYFGSKYFLAKYYPEPKYDLIIEPFAGSAQYAYYHSDKQVILIEKAERVYKIWRWLQRAKKEDILAIPHPAPGEPINYHIAEARDLLALGVKRGQMFGTFAGTKDWTDSWPAKRQKIADGLERIRHWDIRLGSYYQIPNYEATWFIDPPYQGINGYNHRFQHYDDLATWCQSRRGQVIVCEREGATWLPFRSMNYLKRTSISNKPQKEVIWTNKPRRIIPLRNREKAKTV